MNNQGYVMQPFIEKIVGTLGPGEFRFFNTVHRLVNEDVEISKMHLKDLLTKLNYGLHEGTWDGQKFLVVEGGPMPEPEEIESKVFQNDSNILELIGAPSPK